MGENIKFKQSNTIQWHDLSKDPKDLPKEDCETYIAYNIYDETPDLYEYKNSEEGCWELLPSKRIFYSNNQIKVWCEIPKLENKTEPQELCETAILKDVIITDAECSTKPFYYNLSNGIRRLDKVVNTLVFWVHPVGPFCYKTENSIEIEKIMKGIKNRKHFTIKYKKSSHKVIEIISETNTQEQCMEKYNEILRLKEMLTQHQIPFDFSESHGGYHICYPSENNVICSVIEHDGSYGREEDKLEIQGLLTEQESEETDDTVLGYLTAEDVFARINKHFENLANPKNVQPPERNSGNTFLIQQLAKCSDKIKELEQKIAKKKKKISKLKSKNSNFKDIINNLVSENKYIKDKCETLEASYLEAKLDIEGISESEHDLIVKCSELEKCMKVIKETLNKPNINNETKLSEIKKIIDF